jgi:hypothetical protein
VHARFLDIEHSLQSIAVFATQSSQHLLPRLVQVLVASDRQRRRTNVHRRATDGGELKRVADNHDDDTTARTLGAALGRLQDCHQGGEIFQLQHLILINHDQAQATIALLQPLLLTLLENGLDTRGWQRTPHALRKFLSGARLPHERRKCAAVYVGRRLAHGGQDPKLVVRPAVGFYVPSDGVDDNTLAGARLAYNEIARSHAVKHRRL